MIVDTSFLFAFYVLDDSNHERALSDFKAASEQLIITDRILEELITALVYKQGIAFAMAVLEETRTNKAFEAYSVSREEQAGIFNLMKKVRRDLSFYDYSSIYLSHARKERLLSYDRQQMGVLKGLRGV